MIKIRLAVSDDVVKTRLSNISGCRFQVFGVDNLIAPDLATPVLLDQKVKGNSRKIKNPSCSVTLLLSK